MRHAILRSAEFLATPSNDLLHDTILIYIKTLRDSLGTKIRFRKFALAFTHEIDFFKRKKALLPTSHNISSIVHNKRISKQTLCDKHHNRRFESFLHRDVDLCPEDGLQPESEPERLEIQQQLQQFRLKT